MSESIRQLVKEQIQKRLSEEYQDKFKMVGTLIIDIDKRHQKEIASDIRAITGITIVSTKEVIPYSEQNHKQFRSILTVKVDGYPFMKSGGFSRDKMQDIIADIRKVEGVVSFIVQPENITTI
jgi:hypothetical protein